MFSPHIIIKPRRDARKGRSIHVLSHSCHQTLPCKFLETTTLPRYACTYNTITLPGVSLSTIEINLSWVDYPQWEASGRRSMGYLPRYLGRLCFLFSLVSDVLFRIAEVYWRGLQAPSLSQLSVWYIRYLNSGLSWTTDLTGVIETSCQRVNLTKGCWITSTTTSSIWNHSKTIELSMKGPIQVQLPLILQVSRCMSEWALCEQSSAQYHSVWMPHSRHVSLISLVYS
jgi:hypothetical protein